MSEIHLHDAIFNQARYKEQDQAAVRQSQEALEDFLTSNCDMFSSADWFYYAEETGKSIEWLRSNANYSDPDRECMLENALIDGDYELMEFFI
jgi:hypothetical protein